jgi:hypothetical protein
MEKLRSAVSQQLNNFSRVFGLNKQTGGNATFMPPEYYGTTTSSLYSDVPVFTPPYQQGGRTKLQHRTTFQEGGCGTQLGGKRYIKHSAQKGGCGDQKGGCGDQKGGCGYSEMTATYDVQDGGEGVMETDVLENSTADSTVESDVNVSDNTDTQIDDAQTVNVINKVDTQMDTDIYDIDYMDIDEDVSSTSMSDAISSVSSDLSGIGDFTGISMPSIQSGGIPY